MIFYSKEFIFLSKNNLGDNIFFLPNTVTYFTNNYGYLVDYNTLPQENISFENGKEIISLIFKENYCTHKPKLNFEELKGHNEDNKQIKFTSNTAILVLFFIIDFAILYKILNESTS